MSSLAPPDVLADPAKYAAWYAQNRTSTIIGVVTFCLVFATAAVAARTYTRLVIIKRFGIDDVFAILSLLVTFGSGFAIAYLTNFGLGRHVDYAVTLDHSTVGFPMMYLRNFYVTVVLYCAALFFIKQCFLFQYYRVFGVQKMRNVFIAAMFIVGAWSISQVFVGIFMCLPVKAFWNVAMQPTARCIPNTPQFQINAAGNIFTDIVVFALPLPVLKSLNLGQNQKYMLIAIFSLGFFTVALSLLRIKYLDIPADLTWENSTTSLWSIAELCSGVTCSSLSTLHPLVSKYFPRLGTRGGRIGYRRQDDSNKSSGVASASSKKFGAGSQDLELGHKRTHRSSRNATSDSKENICQVGEYELPSRDSSGEHSDGVIGLSSTRDGLGGGSTVAADERIVGLRATVETDIKYMGQQKEYPLGAIQVQRDVVQVKVSRN